MEDMWQNQGSNQWPPEYKSGATDWPSGPGIESMQYLNILSDELQVWFWFDFCFTALRHILGHTENVMTSSTETNNPLVD